MSDTLSSGLSLSGTSFERLPCAGFAIEDEADVLPNKELIASVV